MLTIGFANKYYTLWDCSTFECIDAYDIRYITCSNVYIKNISFDLDKVKALYPDAPINESLKGHTRSFTNSYIEYPNNVFKYGKYRGTPFNECTDYDYMAWYFTTTTKEQQEEMILILEEHDYHIFPKWDMTSYDIETNDEYMDRLRRENAKSQCQEEIIQKLKENNLTIEITSNPDCEGEYLDKNSGFIFKFDEVRVNYYLGFDYYLPVVNGKCKRIKNKTIKIINGEIDDNMIFIHKFEIMKR